MTGEDRGARPARAPGPRVAILCAGASRRLGEPKALASIGGRTVLERLLEAARAVDPTPLVVTGRHHPAIAGASVGLGPLELIRNGAWADGRPTSVAAAVAAAAGRDLVIAPADAPLVRAATVAALDEAWARAGRPPRGWLAPWVPGGAAAPRLFGHPVVLGRELAAEVAGAGGPPTPLRDHRRRAWPLLAVQVDDRGILDDLDTAEDLARLRGRVGG